MEGLLNFVIIYIFFLITWVIINLLFFALTILFRKSFFYIPFAINYLINWMIQIYFIIYPLYLLWQIVLSRQWLLLIVALVFGGFVVSFWVSIMDFLIMPFNLTTVFFSEKSGEKMQKKNEEFDYEYVAPNGEVTAKFESEDKTNKKLAKYFLLDYGVNLLFILTHPNQYPVNGLFYYIFTPAFFLIQAMIFFGLLFGVYFYIRHRKFFYPNKKLFLVKIFKVDLIILVGMQLLALIIYFLFVR